MPISKLSDRNRLLGSSLKNINPTAIYNKVNEVVDTVSFNSSTCLTKVRVDFTTKTYSFIAANVAGGILSVNDDIVGVGSTAIGKIVAIGNTNVPGQKNITFTYDVATTASFYAGESVNDTTSGATFDIVSHSNVNDQLITLKNGNRFIINDLIFHGAYDVNGNPIASVKTTEFTICDAPLLTGNFLATGTGAGGSQTTFLDKVSGAFSMGSNIAPSNIYLSFVPLGFPGYCDLYVMGMILD
jgi:hypothetical protein